jgi:heme/copper-type cytochrome/quinol oxidase subunit 4
VLEKTSVIFASVLAGLAEFTVSVWVYRTIKFSPEQDSTEFPRDTVKAIAAGCVYAGAITLFVWAHFLSKNMIFIFGGISTILLTVSALTVLSKGFFPKKNGFKLIGFLVDVITLLGLLVYLIYLIPSEENLQGIVLTIIAAVIGGAITLAGVAWTIKDNSEKLKEERKFSIKPYLETQIYHYTDVLKLPEEDTIYIEINKGLFTYQGDIPPDIMDFRALKSRVINSENVDPTDQALYDINQDTYSKKRYLFCYEISNHGAGNAINVQFKINKWYIQSFCITTSNPKKFVFILHDNVIPDDKTEYTLEMFLTYSDIASLGNYYQKEELTFCRGEDDILRTVQMSDSILTKPIEIPIGFTGD